MSTAKNLILFAVLFLNTFFATAWAIEKKLNCDGIPFAKCVDTDIHEARMVVPLDWFDKNDLRQIEVKYRIIGYRHTERPLLFFIGGGPGLSSVDSYMLREWRNGVGLANHFRIVVFDQRGNGQSSPLDRGSIHLTPETIARYFSQNQIVRDLGHMIGLFGIQNGVTLMAHSAGGIILSQYLAQPELGPRPEAVVYASSIGGTNPWSFMSHRYKKQIELNRKVMTDDMKADVLGIRARIRDLMRFEEVVPEGMLDARFDNLEDRNLAATLKRLNSPDLTLAEFVKALKDHRAVHFSSDRVMQSLSAAFFGGLTDLEWAELNNSLAGEEEDWMLLERRMNKNLNRSDWLKIQLGPQNELNLRLAGRKYNQVASAEQIRKGAGNIPVLALLGDQDQYVDDKAASEEFHSLFRNLRVEPVEGGDHYASLSEVVAPYIIQFLSELKADRPRLDCQDVLAAKIADTSKPWPYPTGDGKPWYEVK